MLMQLLVECKRFLHEKNNKYVAGLKKRWWGVLVRMCLFGKVFRFLSILFVFLSHYRS